MVLVSTAVAPLDAAWRDHAIDHRDAEVILPHALAPLPSASPSPVSSSTATRTTTKPKPVLDAESSSSTTNQKPKKLSTDRSRLCRQRQKQHVQNLEKTVASLRAEVAELATLRDLRREQLVVAPVSRSGSLARIVHEYCTVFEHGMAPDLGTGVMTVVGRKRTLTSTRQLSAQQQCEFLLSIMDPDVHVLDWVGRSKRGPDPLVYGWKAWSAWHTSLAFRLKRIDVIEAAHDTVAVSTRGMLCVRISPTTVARLFPHIADDEALCRLLIGTEVQYPFRDTFYFNEHGRVSKYTVDVDFVGPLATLIGDYKRVAHLVMPEGKVSFNDRAISTHKGCSIEELRDLHHQIKRDQRLNVEFLLS